MSWPTELVPQVRRAICVALAAPLLGLVSALPAWPAQAPVVLGERIDVTAVSVVIRVSDDQAGGPPLSREEVVVRENGVVRPVVSIHRLGGARREPFDGRSSGIRAPVEAAPAEPVPGTAVTLYFDLAMLGRNAATLLSSAVSDASEQLTSVGPVELLIATSATRVALPFTRDSRRLRAALQELPEGATAFGEVERIRRSLLRGDLGGLPAMGLRSIAEQESALLRQRKRVLLDWVAQVAGLGEPRVLILIGGSYDQDPAEFYLDRLNTDEDRARLAPELGALSQADEDAALGRLLGSLGWMVFAASPSDLGWSSFGNAEQGREESHRRWQQFMAGAAGASGGPDSLFTHPLAGWRTIAEATGGEALSHSRALRDQLRRLGDLYLLTYTRAGAPSGRVFELQVGSVRPETRIGGPRTIAEGTPEEIATLRATATLNGAPPATDLGFSLELGTFQRSETSTTINLRANIDTAGLAAWAPAEREFRVTSILATTTGRQQVRHQLLRLPTTGKQEAFEISLLVPPGNVRLAVWIEDLGTGLSDGRTLELRLEN